MALKTFLAATAATVALSSVASAQVLIDMDALAGQVTGADSDNIANFASIAQSDANLLANISIDVGGSNGTSTQTLEIIEGVALQGANPETSETFWAISGDIASSSEYYETAIFGPEGVVLTATTEATTAALGALSTTGIGVVNSTTLNYEEVADSAAIATNALAHTPNTYADSAWGSQGVSGGLGVITAALYSPAEAIDASIGINVVAGNVALDSADTTAIGAVNSADITAKIPASPVVVVNP